MILTLEQTRYRNLRAIGLLVEEERMDANGELNAPKRSSRMASYSDCPICGKSFPISKILQHADACARKTESVSTSE
jgi:hypothetical protein